MNRKPMETHKALHKLLETCKDSHKAFVTAASAVKDEVLSQTFAEWAEQREHYCTQLTNLLTMLNAPPLYI